MTRTDYLKSIGANFGKFCDAAFPKRGKVVGLQEVLGLGESSAEQLAGGGRVPTTAHLALMKARFGSEFLDFVFADVGEQEERVGRLLRAVNEERVRDAENRAGVAGGDRRPRGVPQPTAPRSGASASRLITVRRPHSSLGDLGCAHLKDRLTRFTERSMTAARAVEFAKADPLKRTGVAVRDGSSWRLLHVAQANGLTSQALTGRRLVDHPDQHYAEVMTRSFDEAAASPDPIITDTAGAVLTANGDIVLTHARILRHAVGDVLMACFAPMAQRQATG